MTGTPPPPLWRVVGVTLLLVLLVVGLEGLVLLTPPAVGLGVAIGVLVLGAVVLGHERARPFREVVRLGEPPAPGRMLPGMLLVALFVLASLLLLRQAVRTIDIPLLNDILGDRSLVNRLRLVGVIVLVGPIGEELALRGWLQAQLERRMFAAWAVLLTALVFGVMHGVDARLGYFVTLGAMFGAAAIVFRSLWAAITLHMTVNAMGAIPLLAGKPGTPPADLAARAPSPWWGAAGAVLVLIAYRAWLQRAARARRA